MVQRYSTYGYDWECETYKDDRGELVKYDDYATLRALLFRLTDHVNLSELPDGLYDDLEKAGLL